MRNASRAPDRDRSNPTGTAPAAVAVGSTPRIVVRAGLNDNDYATEQNEEIPDITLQFGNALTVLTKPHDTIIRPECIEQTDKKAELSIITGHGGKPSIPRKRANTSRAHRR